MTAPERTYSPESVLEIRDLAVSFNTGRGRVRAVDQVDFVLERGQVLGIAGESGCGKSVTALSVMRLLPRPVSRIDQGQILFNGQDLAGLSPEQMHRVRGRKIAMIFQEPMTALNPVHRVARQIMEVYQLHFPGQDKQAMHDQARAMLSQVGIPDPASVMKKYPHQLSGGMRQRVMIAMALACEPDILIADEPTTALDVTVQAQILELITALQEKKRMAVVLITHDLGVIAQNCSRVVVMYAGRVAEEAGVADLFKRPAHPYTRGLLASIPSRAGATKTRLPTIPGQVPSLEAMPPGCRFAPRCERAIDRCTREIPSRVRIGEGHTAACHLAGNQGG